MDGFLIRGKPGPHTIDVAAFRISDADQKTFDSLRSELKLVEIEHHHRVADWGRAVVEKATPQWWITATTMAPTMLAKTYSMAKKGICTSLRTHR